MRSAVRPFCLEDQIETPNIPGSAKIQVSRKLTDSQLEPNAFFCSGWLYCFACEGEAFDGAHIKSLQKFTGNEEITGILFGAIFARDAREFCAGLQR